MQKNSFSRNDVIELSQRVHEMTCGETEPFDMGWDAAVSLVEEIITTLFGVGVGDLEALPRKAEGSEENDPINHPSHYCDGGIECIDYILAKKMDFLLGQVCKCISRAGKKDPARELEDLKKAQFYLNRKIAEMEASHESD